MRLTACWTEACRVLKDGGLLAFTFHHSEDPSGQSFLKAYSRPVSSEQTFPIASDEQKGEGGQFGAKGPSTTSSTFAENGSTNRRGKLGKDAAMGQGRVEAA